MDAEVDLVPLFIKDLWGHNRRHGTESFVGGCGQPTYLSSAEGEGLQRSLVVGDAKLDRRLAWVERHLELWSLTDVADADNAPRRLRRLPRAERADE